MYSEYFIRAYAWSNTWEAKFEELLGKTIVDIKVNDRKDIIWFVTEDTVYQMYHEQDCWEGVYIENIDGDIQCLIGHPITLAEETWNSGDTDWGSQTWTFYKLATVKGYVTIRWLGESNGYYSEHVDFIKAKLNNA